MRHKRTPRKIREWYSTYLALMKAENTPPFRIQLWAAMEAERYAGTARGKLLSHYLRFHK